MKINELITKENNLNEGKSPEEYKLREQMIDRIEGYFGDLQSLQWDKLSTEDLTKIYDTLVDQKQIKPKIKNSLAAKE
jgi:hypothetical protein